MTVCSICHESEPCCCGCGTQRVCDKDPATCRTAKPELPASPRPVRITHPGCDVEPMRCGTCLHKALVGGVIVCGFDDDFSPPSRARAEWQFCGLWRCRKCGGEVTK